MEEVFETAQNMCKYFQETSFRVAKVSYFRAPNVWREALNSFIMQSSGRSVARLSRPDWDREGRKDQTMFSI